MLLRSMFSAMQITSITAVTIPAIFSGIWNMRLFLFLIIYTFDSFLCG